MTAPLDVESSALQADPEAAAKAESAGAVEGRSLGQIAWMRFKRDKVAVAGGVVVIFLTLVAVFHALIATGDPNEPHTNLLDTNLGGLPKGSFGGISGAHLLGLEPGDGLGRDIFSRLVYGLWTSFEIALPATILSVVLGAIVGVTAGYMGGIVDTFLNWVMNVLLAFPVLVFSIALLAVAEHINRKVLLIFVIGFFGWPYIGRIIRGQTLSLREREFVDAARSLGASNSHIIFKQLMPNLFAPLLVYATLIIPTNILQEAALSYLGVGVTVPTASLGDMLSSAVKWSVPDPTYMFVPGAALFITVLAFNLFGDGLRDALDPRAGR